MRGGTGSIYKALAVLVLAITLFAAGNSYAVDVNAEHEVYRFLTRCELKGYLDSRLSRSLPYSHHLVSSLLGQALEHREEMNAVERDQLDRFLFLFADQLPDSVETRRTPIPLEQNRGEQFPWKAAHMFKNPRWAWSAEGSDWLVGFFPHVDLGAESINQGDESGTLYRAATGLSTYGRYGNASLLMTVRDAHLIGDIDLADQARYPKRFNDDDRSGDSFDYDETDAMIAWEQKHVYLLFGKSSNVWAAGATGSFSLYNNATTYSQLRMKLTFEPLEVTWVQAKLIQDPLITYPVVTDGDTLYYEHTPKWMAAHRYDFRVLKNIQVGIWDMVIYGNRDLDWDYLPPTTFLWSAEHYNGDRDNVLMGLDIRWIVGEGNELIFSWLLDELKFSKAATNWFGNKHGYQLGLHSVDPFGINNADLNLEYVMMRPYVYTHTKAINVPQHYGKNLGLPLQPNSAEVLARWRQTLSSTLNVWGETTLVLHGANPASNNVGGDVLVPHENGVDAEEVSFLEGDRETILTGTIGAEWELDLRLFLSASYTLSRYEFKPIDGESNDDLNSRVSVSLTWYPYRWR